MGRDGDSAHVHMGTCAHGLPGTHIQTYIHTALSAENLFFKGEKSQTNKTLSNVLSGLKRMLCSFKFRG